MRLLALLSLCLALSACNQVKQVTFIPARTEVTGIDFTPYTSSGFLFTPEPFSGLYDSVGMLTASVWPESSREASENVSAGSEGRRTRRPGGWTSTQVTVDDALRTMHQRAVAMGADAVVRVTVTRVTETVGVGGLETFTRGGYEVAGFAIKRN